MKPARLLTAELALVDCRERLRRICDILEAAERRAAAVDGPASTTRDALTENDVRRVYRLALAVARPYRQMLRRRRT